MAAAVVCDRCGKPATLLQQGGVLPAGWARIAVQRFRKDAPDPNRPSGIERIYEICPECTSSLDAMMEPVKAHKK